MCLKLECPCYIKHIVIFFLLHHFVEVYKHRNFQERHPLIGNYVAFISTKLYELPVLICLIHMSNFVYMMKKFYFTWKDFGLFCIRKVHLVLEKSSTMVRKKSRTLWLGILWGPHMALLINSKIERAECLLIGRQILSRDTLNNKRLQE